MAQLAIIIGNSGSGKTRSFISLPPDESFIINVAGKPLSFPGWKKNWRYKSETVDGKKLPQNLYKTKDPKQALQVLLKVAELRPNVKNYVIDDTVYLMSGEVMRRRSEKNYEKWSDLSGDIWDLLTVPIESLPDDVKIFFTWHPEVIEVDDDLGVQKIRKAKTLGKALDKNVGIEGLATYVFFTHMTPAEKNPSNRYHFVTQNIGDTTAKTPEGMFGRLLIPNDLAYVIDRMDQYNNDGIVEEWIEE